MSEANLFENEQLILDETEAYLAQKPACSCDCECDSKSHLEKLLVNYKKFFRHFTRIVKINDRQQTELKNREEELKAEIEKRKQIEQRLRENEAQLIQAKEIAENALEDKARFFASMSHEIRTPLNGVLGSANLLNTTRLTKSQQDYIDTIIASGKILLVVINDILDFSKVESGNLELESLPINLESMLEDVFDVINLAATNKGLELVCQCEQLEEINFVGDVTRISQVLVNLINNAIKFTEHGEIKLTVTKKYVKEGKHQLLFALKDTGIGIPQSRMQALFQAFRQVEASTTRKYGGTGLGLSICQKLVELWGGEIWVESQEGHGSTFFFTLPFVEAKQDLSETLHTEPLKGKRILVVDDNQSALDQANCLLQRQGMEVTATTSSAEALNLIGQGMEFDLALIDHFMPRLDGLSLFEEITKETHRKLPTLIMTKTGITLDTDPDRCQPNGFIAKPLKRVPLLRSLMSVQDGTILHPSNDQARDSHPNLSSQFPMRLLMAEDNKINQKIAKATFKLLGYELEIAEDGYNVCDKAMKNHYDLIFMDVHMPKMDGLEATRQLQQTLGPSCPPIIALTANATSQDKQDCLESGMNDYLSKPLLIQDLTAKLSQWGQELGLKPKALETEREFLQSAHHRLEEVDQEILSKEMLLVLVENYSEDLLSELSHYFVEELDDALLELERHIQQKDDEAIQRTAHKIRGSSLNMGAAKLSSVFEEIEDAAMNNNLNRILELFPMAQELKEPTFTNLSKVIPLR